MDNKDIIKQLENFVNDPELGIEERDSWQQVLTDALDEENDSN